MASQTGSTAPDVSRRSFLKAAAALAASRPALRRVLSAQTAAGSARAAGGGAPLMAYVGTFSSPLRDVLPTQVDLPPGNGRGIHLFQVDRTTGALTPAGVRNGNQPELSGAERGRRPACIRPMRRTGWARTRRHGERLRHRPADGQLTLLNTVRRAGPGRPT